MRNSWDEYYMSIANMVATRSTCPRLSVGMVLVRDKMIIATGYNGALSGAPHCVDSSCKLIDGHCMSSVHAEANALMQAARNGTSTSFSNAYITVNPCLSCFKLLYQAGIKRIVYSQSIPEHIYKPQDYTLFGLNANQMPEMVKLSKI